MPSTLINGFKTSKVPIIFRLINKPVLFIYFNKIQSVFFYCITFTPTPAWLFRLINSLNGVVNLTKFKFTRSLRKSCISTKSSPCCKLQIDDRNFAVSNYQHRSFWRKLWIHEFQIMIAIGRIQGFNINIRGMANDMWLQLKDPRSWQL